MLPKPQLLNNDLTPVKRTQRLSIVRGPSHPPLMSIKLGELTRRQSQKLADRVAVVSQHQNEVITYSQLHKHSDYLAAGMIALDIRPGDRVVVMLGNRSEYIYVRRSLCSFAKFVDAKKQTDLLIQLLLACAKIGAISTLLNYAYSHTEIAAALSTTSKLVMTQATQNMLTKNSL